MRPIYFTTVNGDAKVVPLDIYIQPPFQVMIECEVVGAATYGVETTRDNIFDPTVTPIWTASDVAALNPGAVATQRGYQTTPCRALRFSQTAGAGGVKCKVIQQGM